MAPQFVPQPAGQGLQAFFPHIPLSEVGERHGSGKLTLNKSGASGTRVWQCPWFMHPAFCDFLLGRTAVNPNGRPQNNRPDVFSVCYPWLYCQEVSVEGEDLLGVDLTLRAFYRRAIVTAKYMPLEMNNSIHINSQMLTIPDSQFIFIGTNPTNLCDFQQIFTVEIQGKPNSGTFQLGFASDSSSATFIVPAQSISPGGNTVTAQDTIPLEGVSYTDDIPYDASPATVRKAVRKALGITPQYNIDVSIDPDNPTITEVDTDRPDAVTVTGPEGKPGATGPWTIKLKWETVMSGYALSSLKSTAAGILLYKGFHDRKIDVRTEKGDYMYQWWRSVTNVGAKGDGLPGTSHSTTGFRATDDLVYSIDWSGRYTSGSFRFKMTGYDAFGSKPDDVAFTNWSEEVFAASATPNELFLALKSMLNGYKKSAPLDKNRQIEDFQMMGLPADSKSSPLVCYGELNQKSCVWMSKPYLNGQQIKPIKVDPSAPLAPKPIWGQTLSQMSLENKDQPLIIYFQLHSLKEGISYQIEIDWTGNGSTEPGRPDPPAAKIVKFDPYLANRMDQNVGKVVPMGEITFQRHQVIGMDMLYLLSVVGTVNMFTFQGFPPWTLLLSGIEAKQTRLPNGTPCFDMTFKFAFNPYTHQAIFRPKFMRWEFVRGVLVSRIPKAVMVPIQPLDELTNRAKLNPIAAKGAFFDPNDPEKFPDAKKRVPRIIPAKISPMDGSILKGGTKSIFAGDGPNPGNQNLGDGAGGSGGSGGTGDINNNGDIKPPYGTVDANAVTGTTGKILDSLGEAPTQDPNVANDDPYQAWLGKSNQLGKLIADSVGGGPGGLANDDQTAAASGIAEDIRIGTEQGAPWSSAAKSGVDTGGGSGDLAYDLALARAAHKCGAMLHPNTIKLLGLPANYHPNPSQMKLGGPGPPPPGPGPGPGNAVPGDQQAINVGAAKSVQDMVTRVYDVGFIYPICDFTPIIWMQ
jgi:hypothetical protein